MKVTAPGFSLKALRTCSSGLALIEFALVAPMMLILLIGANELTRWIRARQHLEDFATTVANDVSATSGDIPAATLRELIERIGLVAPELVDPKQNAWDSTNVKKSNTNYLGVGISLATVTLSDLTCHIACSYTTKLQWTFGNYQRNCTDAITMPGGSVQEGPVVIVDVNTQYKYVFGPALGKFSPVGMFGAAPIMKTTTFQPVKNWKYVPTGAASTSGTFPKVDPATASEWTVKNCT